MKEHYGPEEIMRRIFDEKGFEIGTESKGEKIVRCKDCKYMSMTTIGMPYACWHRAENIFGETGEHASHTVCTRLDSLEHYCGYAERSEE